MRMITVTLFHTASVMVSLAIYHSRTLCTFAEKSPLHTVMMEPFVRMEEGVVQIYKSKFGMENPRVCVYSCARVVSYSHVNSLSSYRSHPGCECTPDWEGPHCEYIKGTFYKQPIEKSDKVAFALYGFAISLLIMAVVMVVAFAQKRRMTKSKQDVVKEEEEKDGLFRSVLEDYERNRDDDEEESDGSDEEYGSSSGDESESSGNECDGSDEELQVE